jgi:DNA-binding transcriptional regulator LsrR (DeoR family)
MAWARSLRGIGTSIKGLAACPVVQLTGALSGPDGSDVIDLVRRVAAAGGGTPHVFYAPLVAPDLASARVVRRQPDVSRAMALAAKVTVAMVGIGAWQPGMSTIFDMIEPAARERARAQGTIGEISGALIDANGRAVTSALSRRIIGVTAAELEAIDVVISVAYGEEKARAVSAALRGGFVNGLITHTALARALLDPARSAGAAPH